MNVFSNFLNLTCVNCRGVSAVVSLNNSILFLSISCEVLRSGKARGFVKL